jgi:hypothetical protein
LPGQPGIFEEGALAQLQFARLAVEQGDGAGGEALRADVEVGQANVAVDHPGRLVAGRQYAQLVRRTLAARAFAAEGTGAAGQVAGQGVVVRALVVAGVVMVGPQRRGQFVAQLGAAQQTRVGRAAERLEHQILFEAGHRAAGGCRRCCHPTPTAPRRQRRTTDKRKFVQAAMVGREETARINGALS